MRRHFLRLLSIAVSFLALTRAALLEAEGSASAGSGSSPFVMPRTAGFLLPPRTPTPSDSKQEKHRKTSNLTVGEEKSRRQTGHVSSDGSEIYYDPNREGPGELQRLLEEALRKQQENQ